MAIKTLSGLAAGLPENFKEITLYGTPEDIQREKEVFIALDGDFKNAVKQMRDAVPELAKAAGGKIDLETLQAKESELYIQPLLKKAAKLESAHHLRPDSKLGNAVLTVIEREAAMKSAQEIAKMHSNLIADKNLIQPQPAPAGNHSSDHANGIENDIDKLVAEVAIAIQNMIVGTFNHVEGAPHFPAQTRGLTQGPKKNNSPGHT